MAFNPVPPPADIDPSEFENFKPKSGFRDYLIYTLVLLFVAAVAGGAVYYFTRSDAEKEKLLAMFGKGKKAELRTIERRTDPRLESVLGEGPEVPDASASSESQPRPKAVPVAVSAYAGGGQNGVTLSDNPNLPKATPEFVAFVEALKVSSVMDGNPAKAMFNGRVIRAGDLIDATSGVRFSGVNGVKKHLILNDQSGAEVYRAY